jgi:amino acid permease
MAKKGVNNSIIPAAAIISGTAIGAGYLSIPYVVSKPGFLVGLVYIVVLGLITLFFKLVLGEVILRTRTIHQLTGYAEKYLGKKGKYLMFFSMIFGIYSALIAYLIAEGESLSFLFFGNFHYFLLFSLIFWVILAFVSYIGTEALKRFDKIGLLLVGVLLVVLIIFSINKINFFNLSYSHFQGKDLFLPIGVILFSFIGFSSIPEARKVLYNNEKKFKKAIILGICIPIIFYVIFTFVIVGIFGQRVNEIATLSLARIFSLIAIITIFNSSFSQTISIRDMFRYDFGISRFYSWCLACFTPPILFIIILRFELASFIELLSFSGIVSAGLTIILIFLMKEKALKLGERKPEYSMKPNKIIFYLVLVILLIGVYSAIEGYLR